MTLVEGEVYFQRSDKLTPFEPAAAGPTRPGATVKLPAVKPGDSRSCFATRRFTRRAQAPEVARRAGRQRGKIRRGRRRTWTRTAAAVVEAKGLHLFPGLIDAGTQVGLTEIGSARETHDFAEGGDFQPDLRAAVAVNPESELIPVTRANGVTDRGRPADRRRSSAGRRRSSTWPAGCRRRWRWSIRSPCTSSSRREPGHLRTTRRSPASAGRSPKKQREEKLRKLKELFAEANRYDAGRKPRTRTGRSSRDWRRCSRTPAGEKPVIVTGVPQAGIARRPQARRRVEAQGHPERGDGRLEGGRRAEEAGRAGDRRPGHERCRREGRPVRRPVRQRGQAARGRRAVLHPLDRLEQRAQPAVRGGDGGVATACRRRRR